MIRLPMAQNRMPVVVGDRRAKRCHVYAQLMLASCSWCQRITPPVLAALKHRDPGFAVGLALAFHHPEKRLAAQQSAASDQRKRDGWQWPCQRLVALADAVLGQQPMIGRPRADGRESGRKRG